MFIWPMTIVHKINEKSPLYGLSASDMLRERFEIVVMLGEFCQSCQECCSIFSLIQFSDCEWVSLPKRHNFENENCLRKGIESYAMYNVFSFLFGRFIAPKGAPNLNSSIDTWTLF